MANYLERVAAAGMRTSVAAKPPVVGPPILPGRGLPDLTLASAMEQGESRDIQRDKVEVEPLLPAAPAAMNRPTFPQSGERSPFQGQLSPTSSAMPIIQASKMVQPAHTPFSNAPRVNQRMEHDQAAPSPDVPQVNQPARPNVNMSPVDSTDTVLLTSKTPYRKEPTSTAPVLSSLSSASSDADVPMPHKQVKDVDKPPMDAASHIVRIRELVEGKTRPPVTAAPRMSQSNTSQAFDKVAHDRAHRVQSAQPVLPQASTPVLPPTHTPARQVKLTIGRLDVQVHNRPPVPPVVRSSPPASPPVTHALELHYLDRFRFKP